jgi:hypothetical protein
MGIDIFRIMSVLPGNLNTYAKCLICNGFCLAACYNAISAFRFPFVSQGLSRGEREMGRKGFPCDVISCFLLKLDTLGMRTYPGQKRDFSARCYVYICERGCSMEFDWMVYSQPKSRCRFFMWKIVFNSGPEMNERSH